MSLGNMTCSRCTEGFEPHEKIVNSNGELWHTQCFVYVLIQLSLKKKDLINFCLICLVVLSASVHFKMAFFMNLKNVNTVKEIFMYSSLHAVINAGNLLSVV